MEYTYSFKKIEILKKALKKVIKSNKSNKR
jgi:hypothetical protein